MAIEIESAVDQRELTAYHEAGHAVACWALRRRFSYVTLVPGEDFLGQLVGRGLPKGFDPNYGWTPGRIRWTA